MRHHFFKGIIALFLLFQIFLLPLTSVQAIEPSANFPQVRGNQLVTPSGNRFFLQGVNYLGAADRAWEMWEDSRFDIALIERDMRLMQFGGFNSVRLVVREALAKEVLAGSFDKLDTVINLAAKYQIYILLTLADYGEGNLERLSTVDTAIVSRYTDKSRYPYLLGYDLKNEPQLSSLLLADYPAGVTVSLNSRTVLNSYGERLTLAAALSQRSEGKIPAWVSDEQAYLYANYHALYREMLAEAAKWAEQAGMPTVPPVKEDWGVRPHPTQLDYFNIPEAAKWQPLRTAINQSLETWLTIRLEPMQKLDRQSLYTVGYNDLFLAHLPANKLLSFRSIHTYGDAYRVQTQVSLLHHFKSYGQPVVLEEFGYSNYEWQPDQPGPVSEGVSALFETAMWLYLYQEGFSGGYKWMLYDAPPQPSKIEASYGLLRGDTSPKPAYHAAHGFSGLQGKGLPVGEFKFLESADGKHTRYLWQASHSSASATYGGGTFFEDGKVIFLQADTHYFNILTEQKAALTEIQVSAGSPFWLWLDLAKVTELPVQTVQIWSGTTLISFEQDGAKINFGGLPNQTYQIKIRATLP
jgi:hypothetical protein